MHSTHYAGADVTIKIGPNEPWKKVYGPVFAYLNSLSDGRDPLSLWEDAKKQVLPQITSGKIPNHEIYCYVSLI